MFEGLKTRGKAAEGFFARRAEQKFKLLAKRNQKLIAWAADRIGLSGEERERYTDQLLAISVRPNHEKEIVERLLDDFDVYGVSCPPKELKQTMKGFYTEAKKETED